MQEACVLWGGAVTPDGYPRRFYNGKNGYAHRIAYEIKRGPIPRGCYLQRQCENIRCVNPYHYEIRKRSELSKDHNRGGRGDRLLTDEQVREILTRLRNGESQVKLAKEYPVSRTSINRIARGENYREIYDELLEEDPDRQD